MTYRRCLSAFGFALAASAAALAQSAAPTAALSTAGPVKRRPQSPFRQRHRRHRRRQSHHVDDVRREIANMRRKSSARPATKRSSTRNSSSSRTASSKTSSTASFIHQGIQKGKGRQGKRAHPGQFHRQPHRRNPERAVRQRPLEVSRLPPLPRPHAPRISQGAGGRHHLSLHAGQQRKSQSVVSPVRIETYYRENKDRFYQEDRSTCVSFQLSTSEGATEAEPRPRPRKSSPASAPA